MLSPAQLHDKPRPPAFHTDAQTGILPLEPSLSHLMRRDKETEGHAERVVAFSVRLGQELGMSGYDLISLELGSRLHDIGKIAVPDSVLKKPGPLNEDEWTKMRIHPVKGQEMVRAMGLPETAALIVGQHHEQWNGKDIR